MQPLIVRNLSKTFHYRTWPLFGTKKQFTAVNNISFELNKGEILGFLGPNGAGKTTTIHMLLGVLTQSSGSIAYFGKDFATHRIEILRKLGYASGYDKLPSKLTVFENLDIVGRIYGMNQQERTRQIEKYLTFFGMSEFCNRQVAGLSAGQTTRVLLAKAFMAEPDIVLLDEPTASLDPDIAYEVRQFILAQRKERGVSMLITSHNMDEVTELCDRVLVLKKGTIIADNTPDTLAQSIAKVRVHLTITSNVTQAGTLLAHNNYLHTIENNQITIEIDEHAIAQLLSQLGKHEITYSQISIDKPTLEDYFLSIAK